MREFWRRGWDSNLLSGWRRQTLRGGPLGLSRSGGSEDGVPRAPGNGTSRSANISREQVVAEDRCAPRVG
jgi:hypothetical protein